MLAKMLVVLVVLFSSFNSGLPGMFLSSWLLLWNRLRLQKKAYLCHFLNHTSFVRKTIFEFIQDLLNTWSQSIFSFAPPLPNFLTKRWVIMNTQRPNTTSDRCKETQGWGSFLSARNLFMVSSPIPKSINLLSRLIHYNALLFSFSFIKTFLCPLLPSPQLICDLLRMMLNWPLKLSKQGSC